jgi:hypothetical protein
MVSGVDITHIVIADFEFAENGLGWPVTRCLCYQNIANGEMVKLWADEFSSSAPGVFTDPDTVLVTYGAKAELSCFKALRRVYKFEFISDRSTNSFLQSEGI